LFAYSKSGRRSGLAAAGVLGVVACGLAVFEITDLNRQGPMLSVGWGLYLEVVAAGVLVASSARLWRATF
jgi:hypothetical protein